MNKVTNDNPEPKKGTVNTLTSFPSPESYDLTFLTAALIAVSSIAFAILLIRSARNQDGRTKEIRIPNN